MKLILGEIVVMTLIGFIIDLITMKFSNYRANKFNNYVAQSVYSSLYTDLFYLDS
ncbi:MAG: hypothetical protein AB6733_00395 [Clostridiaceae bacterium]